MSEEYLFWDVEQWVATMNVETLCCPLPTFDEICNGTHRVIAVGNDMVAAEANIFTDVYMESPDWGVVSQMLHLGKWLKAARSMETTALH